MATNALKHHAYGTHEYWYKEVDSEKRFAGLSLDIRSLE
jgi:hypothetical protein